MEFLLLIIGIAIGVIAWKSRLSAYKQVEQFGERVELQIKDNQADMQEDYDELLKKIADIKSKQGGKWYSMSDIDNEMKSNNTK